MMIRARVQLTMFLPLVAASGCAGFTTYNKPRLVDDTRVTATYIDAKQRAVFSAPAYDDQLKTSVMKFCAEPSPDALSAIAGGASGGLNAHDKVALQAAFTIAESASSIGLRTQSIQLMRDSMFRLCEASMSHNQSPQFWSAFRYFQNSMVTILAIEQLTGVVRAPTAQLTTTSTATPNKDVTALNTSLTTAKAALATDQADAAIKQKALTDALTAASDYLKKNNADTEDKLAADQTAGYAPLKQAVTDAKTANDAVTIKAAGDQKTVDGYQAAITALGPVTLASSGTAATSTPEAVAAGQAAVADAVKAIVFEQLRGGFLRQTCATLYDEELQAQKAIAPDTALHKACDTWAMNTANGKIEPDQPNAKVTAGLPGKGTTVTVASSNGPIGTVLLDEKITLPKDVVNRMFGRQADPKAAPKSAAKKAVPKRVAK